MGEGKTITVRYTAGKDGFRILEGAHVHTGATGREAAAFVAKAPAPVAPVQVAAPVQQAAPVAQSIDYDYVDTPVDPNFNPFINPHDPTHRNFQFNRNGANFGGNNVNAFANSVPPCADCAGVNPFINPFDASHQQAGLLAGHQAGVQFRAPVTARPAAPVQPVQQAFVLQTTTPAPKRFFPPGQLKLNRFESGFNFDFSSQ